MVGAPFGQSQTGDKKTGKKGGKGKQVVKKVNGKQDKAAASQGHAGAVLCLAASEDGKYLLTGGKDKVIGVWAVDSPITSEEGAMDVGVKWMRGLAGHKDAVTVSTRYSEKILKLTPFAGTRPSIAKQPITPIRLRLGRQIPMPTLHLHLIPHRHLFRTPRLYQCRFVDKADDRGHERRQGSDVSLVEIGRRGSACFPCGYQEYRGAWQEA